MPAPREAEQLYKAARLYFEDGASQQETADRLGVSRASVSRMLKAAREQGIVEIRVNDPSGRDVQLETALRDTFGLVDARVAAAGPTSAGLDRVGFFAAQWLIPALADAATLGLSWGTSLQAVLLAVQQLRRTADVEVVPMVGGLSSVNSETTGEELVRQMAVALGGTYRYLHAPALLSSQRAADALRAEASISESLASASSVDVALVGIGSIAHGSSAKVVAGLQLSESERLEFLRQSPAGDICARFFDHQGTSLTGAASMRVIGVTHNDLRRIPLVAGIAAGAQKAQGTLAALRGSLLDVLVCDAALARGILRVDARTPPQLAATG